MRLDRQNLLSALQILGTSVGNKVIEVASYVCFRVDKEQQAVVLFTTDFNAFLAVQLGDVSLAGIEDMPDVFLIDYKMLTAVLKSSTSESVDFTNEKNSVIITTNGKYTFRKYQNTDDFPSADLSCGSYVNWPVPIVASSWSKASISVSKDATKINYQGVYFDGNFVATDGRRLSHVSGDGYDGKPMLIPPVFGDILKHCKNEIQVGRNEAGNLLVVICPEVGLIAGIRLIDATFISYDTIMSKMNPQFFVTVPKQEVLGSISRLTPFTDKLFKVVEITLIHTEKGNKLKFSVENKDAGEEIISVEEMRPADEDVMQDVLDKHSGGDLVLMKSKYHIENLFVGVAAVDTSEDVCLNFQEDGKLWITNDENFTYLLTCIT